jgi:UDP-glucose 4-epimerase
MLKVKGAECIFYGDGEAKGADAFLHLASKSVFDHPYEITKSNIDLLHKAIDSCYSCEIKNFVFFSAMSVYGNIDKENLSENEPLVAPDLYSVSKFYGELVLKEAPLNVLVLRLPAVLGVRNTSNIFGRTLKKLKNSEKVEISNAEKIFNNFINVEQIAEFLSRYPFDEKYEVVNLASAMGLTLYDVMKLVAELSGSKSEIVNTNEIRNFFNISTEKAETRYGFKPLDAKYAIESWFHLMKEYS